MMKMLDWKLKLINDVFRTGKYNPETDLKTRDDVLDEIHYLCVNHNIDMSENNYQKLADKYYELLKEGNN